MPQHIYLTKVSYLEEKGEIICYFENKNMKKAKRFPFLPYLILHNSINPKKLEEILIEFKIKNFKIKENKLFANSSKDLKKISNFIAQISSKKHLVLDPERIFLIEKDWSYFDSFDLNFNKTNSKNLSFHLFKNINFREALCLNPTSLILIEQSAASNILKIPIQKIPSKLEEKIEFFLENIYFKNGEIISWDNKENFFSAKEFFPFGEFSSLSKIDFSEVWSQLLTNNFFNIGNTNNCSCCRPIKLEDSNLLPSSKIEVKAKEDFFYSSTNNTFALFFHKNNPNKNERKIKKYEFCLKEYPIGPIKSNDNLKLPIDDVKKLIQEKKVSLEKEHDLKWFCKNNESFISKEIKLLNKKIKENNVIEFKTILIENDDFDKLYSKKLMEISNQILINIPYHLTNHFSKFFSLSLAENIISIQESTISKFKEFSEKAGYRIIYASKKNVFVKGYSSLSLTSKFAKKMSLPRPIIASFAKNSRFKTD